jgi:hypothetical protein
MPKIFNLYSDPDWDRTEDRTGWRSKDAWNRPEFLHYPDSDKWAANDLKGERVLLGLVDPTDDYWEGEE